MKTLLLKKAWVTFANTCNTEWTKWWRSTDCIPDLSFSSPLSTPGELFGIYYLYHNLLSPLFFLFHWFQFIHHFLIHTHTPSTVPLWLNSSYSNLLPISCTTWSDCSFLACSLERIKPQRWLLGQMYERRFIFQEIAAKKPRHIHPTIPNWKWARLIFNYLNFRELEAWYEMKTYWILFPSPPSPQCLSITFAIFPIWNVFLPPLHSCPSSTSNLFMYLISLGKLKKWN